MRNVSDTFLQALGGPQRLSSRAEIWDANTTTWQPYTFVSGKITADYFADVMRVLDADIAPSQTSIDNAVRLDTQTATIYGTYVRTFRGIRFPDDSVEEVPLGVFVIDSLARDRPEATVKIKGSDLYMQVNRARLITPRTVKGASRIEIVKTLIREALEPNLPWGPVQFWVHPEVDDYRLGATMIERDRGKAIQQILGGISARGYFDPEGTFVIAPISDPNTTVPVWSVRPGEGGTLVSYKEDVSREGVYNAVSATGESNDEDSAPVTGIAYDLDPTSPTYYNGPFGKVPYFFSSQFIYTQQQADLAATRRLVSVKGASHKHNLSAVPNPALEPGDVIRLFQTDGTVESHLVLVMKIGMAAPDSMEVDTQVGKGADVGLLPADIMSNPDSWVGYGFGYSQTHAQPTIESGGVRFTWNPNPTANPANGALFAGSLSKTMKAGRKYLIRMTVRADVGAAPWRMTVAYTASDEWITPSDAYQEREWLYEPVEDVTQPVGIEVQPQAAPDWSSAGSHLVTEFSVLEYPEGPNG